MSRETELLSAADKFIATHNQWVDSPESKLITQGYEDALLECVREFASGDLPATCRSLAAAVDALSDEWSDYEGYVSQSAPMPKDTFWEAVQKLITERVGSTPDTRKPIEPVRVLLKQKVTPRQIAVIYSHNGNGPFMRNGIPQEHLVYKESETPGSVIPKDWTHPADEARLAESRKTEDLRITRLASKGTTFKPCPESIEELLRQKVFPNQIAQMRGCSVEQVLAEAERLSIPTTASAKESLDLARQHNPALPAAEDDAPYLGDDDDETELAEEADVEAAGEAEAEVSSELPVEEQIAALADDGLTSKQIADRLGISIQKAAGVIRRLKQQAPEAVAANG